MALSDIEIAHSVAPKNIYEVANAAGIDEKYVIPYGRYKAKIDTAVLNGKQPNGKLILVTALTPTPAGEGKTTVSIGLVDALRRVGKKAVAALREPSLGPVFGLKGGATGGGRSQIIPMEDINLHFNGDFHAVTSANNLLAAVVDNHIRKGNELNIDPATVCFKRCLDMDDRQLRFIVSGLGGAAHGVPREDGFDITAASEIMAIWCLSKDIWDLKRRFSQIIVGYTFDKQPVTAGQLNVHGAMAVLMKEAMYPNLVQTLEGTPVLVHGGPFANIAHGCNTIIATKTAMSIADYAVTEAGFGADLGAEKFLDIKCRMAGIVPSAVVMVASVRALKMHGGVAKVDLGKEDVGAVEKGFKNLERHLRNITEVYGLPVVAALNVFGSDTEAEKQAVIRLCRGVGVDCVPADVWGKGSLGTIELAEKVIEAAKAPSAFDYAYPLTDSVEEKIEKIVTRVYRGKGAEILKPAAAKLERFKEMGYGDCPVCIAKTQYSFSDDPKKTGAPEDFTVTVRDVRLSAGAGFIVALTGDIITMPGLPKHPQSEVIDIDENGNIVGLQ